MLLGHKNKHIESRVWDILKQVQDPELHKDLVSLQMIKGVQVDSGKVKISVELTTPACPLRKEIQEEVTRQVRAVEGVENVELEFSAQVRQAPGIREKIPGIKNIIAVASGKGGVGKSTVAVNIALALHHHGAKVGLLDADIYGPNVPLMMGVTEGKLAMGPQGKILPIESYGLKLMSMGFVATAGRSVVWRGPMVHKALEEFLSRVEWGEMDYLVIDMPPGTGDVQISLSQLIPLAGAVVVTTPQDVALLDVQKCVDMFQKVNIPILGLVENMSYFLCPHCGDRSEIFSHGGGKRASEAWGIPFLGDIPIVGEIREGGDAGEPIVATQPKSPAAEAFLTLARVLAGKISVIDVQGKIDIQFEEVSA